jgi:type IV fimbrial biogenesis protein FimT
MRQYQGFTLLEMTVVIAIVAVLSMLAAPSFQRLIQTTNVSNNVNSFMADLRYARSEAIRRGGHVVMCRSNAPEALNAVCNNGFGADNKGWVSGWLIFHDTNNDGNWDAGEPLLRVQGPISSLNAIKEDRASGTPTARFQFTATGRMSNLSSAATLKFGEEPAFALDVQRTLCVGLGGRGRIAGDGNISC